ncbi:hypothetical protein K470DRAFT_270635 [Piedraia hortae CBS 480.64]|uniref:Uncharacterized protein n=1 Tax=Piedraia hortae CBS 480.64 TaxID=1314780 RepID=A0A6A7BZG9_9PEZI|nr:hypothetical protein K470DRAFT_270635 [Piedraia hortae CBS 480.64]
MENSPPSRCFPFGTPSSNIAPFVSALSNPPPSCPLLHDEGRLWKACLAEIEAYNWENAREKRAEGKMRAVGDMDMNVQEAVGSGGRMEIDEISLVDREERARTKLSDIVNGILNGQGGGPVDGIKGPVGMGEVPEGESGEVKHVVVGSESMGAEEVGGMDERAVKEVGGAEEDVKMEEDVEVKDDGETEKVASKKMAGAKQQTKNDRRRVSAVPGCVTSYSNVARKMKSDLKRARQISKPPKKSSTNASNGKDANIDCKEYNKAFEQKLRGF